MSSSARDHDLTTCAATAQEPLREAFAELARVASVARHISWATADGGGMIDPADLRLLLADNERLRAALGDIDAKADLGSKATTGGVSEAFAHIRDFARSAVGGQ